MNVPSVLACFAWVLVVGAVASLGIALCEGDSFFEGLKNALPAGVLLALAGHLFTQSKTLVESAEKRSLFNLEGFRRAFEHAKSLLEDGNNNRPTWIEAARSLSHGEELAKGVSVETHNRVLELDRLKYRSCFFQILAEKPAAFFYGVSSTYSNLDDAARASTAAEESDGRHVISTNHAIEEASIRAVWLAASWPKNYDDPMTSRFEPEEVGKVMLLYPKLHQFLEHKLTVQSAAGQLHPRTDER